MKTHLQIVIEQRQHNSQQREDDEDAKCRKGETDFEDLESRGEDDCQSVAVDDGQEEPVKDVPRHLLRDVLHDASASQRLMSQRHSTSFELLIL